MLIFRGNDWTRKLSPEQIQGVVNDWMAWFGRLSEQGKVVAGNPLEPTGKLVSGQNGRIVTDGAFAESKEAVGGYFLLKVESVDEAVAIAQQCPALPHGIVVEVRPLAETCPLAAKLAAEAQLAGAAA